MRKIENLALVIAMILLQSLVFTDFSPMDVSFQHFLTSLIFSAFLLAIGLITRLIFLRIERGELSESLKIVSMFGAIVSIIPLIIIYVFIVKNIGQIHDLAPGPFWLLLYPLSLFLIRFFRYLDLVAK